MVDAHPSFEGQDNLGSTVQSSGSVDTVGVLFPLVSGPRMSEFLIQCPEDQELSYRLLISVNGADFLTLRPSGHWAWTPKGDTVTQLTIKSNTNAGVLYEVVANFEVD